MTEDVKRCPACGEEILAVAKKCKHCGEFIDESNNIKISSTTSNVAPSHNAKPSQNVNPLLLAIFYTIVFSMVFFTVIAVVMGVVGIKSEVAILIALSISFVTGIYFAIKVAYRNVEHGNEKLNLSISTLVNSTVVQVISVVAIGFLLSVFFFGKGNIGSMNIYTCEIHEFSSCKGGWLTGGEIDCLFTNKSKVGVNPSQFFAWNYDSNGMLLEKKYIHKASSVAPNSTAHMKIHIPSGTKETVICSMNPKSGFLNRGLWKAAN